MIKSRLRRISEELDNEIKRVANNNKLKYTEATRKVAKTIQNKRDKKIIIQDEIKF